MKWLRSGKSGKQEIDIYSFDFALNKIRDVPCHTNLKDFTHQKFMTTHI